MPVNALIPLAGKPVDAARAGVAAANVNRARQFTENLGTRNQLLEQSVANEARLTPAREAAANNQVDAADIRSAALGATVLQEFVTAGDLEGGANYLAERIAQAEQTGGRDMGGSRRMLPHVQLAAQTGDTKAVQEIIDGVMAADARFNPGANTGARNVQSTFVDPQGNVIQVLRDGTMVNTGQKRGKRQLVPDGAGGFISQDVNDPVADSSTVLPTDVAIQNAADLETATTEAQIGAETSPEAVAAQAAAAGTIATATATATARVKDLATAQKRIDGADATVRKIDSVIEEAEIALARVGPGTTGAPGFLTSGIPGTESFALAAGIRTIQANLAFKELQEMRANSPTGGALGQVSERELGLLEGALVALDQANNEGDVVRALEKVVTHYGNWKDVIAVQKERDEALLKENTTNIDRFTISVVPGKPDK